MPKAVTMKISEEVDTLLDEVSNEVGCSREDVLRRGLAVMKAFSQERKQGNTHIGFVADPSKLNSEVVGVL